MSLHTAPADRPWLKNRRWATGRIRDQSTSFVFFSLLFTLIFNSIAVFAAVSAWNDPTQGHGLFVLPAVFFALGLLMLAWSVRQIRVRTRFGQSVLELETLPGVVGGYLAGTIRVPARLDPATGVRLELACVTRVPDNPIPGTKRTYWEQNLFEGHQHLRGHNLPHDDTSTQIPVSFHIPPTAPPTGRRAPRPVSWRLCARAPQPGPDYLATFIVPVFEVPDAPVTPPQAESVAAPLRTSHSPLTPVDRA